MGAVLHLVGRQFGRLTVTQRSTRRDFNKAWWICKCDCGKDTIVNGAHLVDGTTKSCGCLRVKHGMKKSRLYRIWKSMKARCGNEREKDYARYGARGISVCAEWKEDFSAFARWSLENGYSDNLSIDRIDGGKGYSPDNCRWANWLTQARNRTSTKLSPPLVEEIRNSFKSGRRSNYAHTALEFGVSASVISDVVREKAWPINSGPGKE